MADVYFPSSVMPSRPREKRAQGSRTLKPKPARLLKTSFSTQYRTLNQERLENVRQILAIVHHIPGRVRIKLKSSQEAAQLGLHSNDLQHFIGVLREIEGIQSASVNTVALSCTVLYDSSLIAPGAWHELLGESEPGASKEKSASDLLSAIREHLDQGEV